MWVWGSRDFSSSVASRFVQGIYRARDNRLKLSRCGVQAAQWYTAGDRLELWIEDLGLRESVDSLSGIDAGSTLLPENGVRTGGFRVDRIPI